MSAMRQAAPWPQALEYLTGRLHYRPGRTFRLAGIDRGQGSKGLTLIITTRGYDSYHPERGENYRVSHYMPVPPAAAGARSWQRWLFGQLLPGGRHEAMEFFALTGPSDEGPALVRPYAPHHQPGHDPYLVREVGTDADRRTSSRGDVGPLARECEHQAPDFTPCRTCGA